MQYIIKKTVILAITLFLISTLTFVTFHVVPGDPALLILGTEASPEKAQDLRVQLGTDKPLGVQYVTWFVNFLQGDFGTSIKYEQPVSKMVAERIPVTLLLSLLSITFIGGIGIPIGVYAAKKRNSFMDPLLNALSMLSISVPGFFLSILFIWIFGLVLHLFVPGQYIDYQENLAGFLKFMIFPAFAIAIPNIAILVKYLRASIIGELEKDYVRTAYGKGNRENRVLTHHVLKNAIVSVIPLLGMMIGEVFSGSIIVEQVFGIPGIGRLLISSITSRDFPLTQTLVIYIAVIIVITNSLVDIVMQVIDPRIRVK